MEGAKEISKKRARLSLPATRSLMGSFSRSNRGKKLRNSLAAEDSPMGYGLPSVSIKDLRSRRIFSPSSTDGVIPNSFDDTEKLGKSPIPGIRLGGTQEQTENGDFQRIGTLNGDFGQSTPPDPEIFRAEPVVEKNGSEISDQFSEKKTCERPERGFHGQRDGMNYSMKSVLKPCSRAKLFRTPASFSYRRLLPYLMDIEKGYSGSHTMGQCQKSDKDSEVKNLLAANSPKLSDDKTTSCSLEGHSTDCTDSGKPLIAASVESFTSKDSQLQASCDDRELSCSKNYLSSTAEKSHFNEENLADVVSRNETLMDIDEVAKTDVECPSNARDHEVTVNDKSKSCDYEVTESSKGDTMKSGIQEMPKGTICHSIESHRLNSVDPALSEMGGNSKCSLQQRVDNGSEDVELVEDLDGKCMSTTPPDSDIFSRCEIDDSIGNTADAVSQGTSQVIQKSSDETFCRNNGQGHDKSPGSSPKNKMVPNPNLHLKLSKIPGSFSYRRLLPYLVDIASHNSGASGNNQSLKVEKNSKAKSLSSFFTSGKDACTETSNDKILPIEHQTGDGIMLPLVAATATSSSNHKLARSPPKQVTEPLVKPSTPDTSQKLNTRPKDMVDSPAMASSSPGVECAKLPIETEEDCLKSTEKCANHKNQIEADSFVEASTSPGIPAASVQKGILKKYPRGCRGNCTCLNCCSFRLHAEKSFEFSRNQMQDAEEVALDLMKELSYLRNMLEKSTFVSQDQTTISIDQVREACRKASDAEELAKSRLSEMNYHLNIHCRIPCGPRPIVRFANYVEEHIIRPTSDPSNK